MTNAQIFEACRKHADVQVYYAHCLTLDNAGFDVNDRLTESQLVEYVRGLDVVLACDVIEAHAVAIIRAMGI
jgi:hypothetical protein